MLTDSYKKYTSAPIIAFIGCDGSGKSTLSAEITSILNKKRKTCLIYLGLGSGDMGRRIQKWPLIGNKIEKILSKKAKKTRTPGEVIPGFLTAFIVFLFSCKRLYFFHKLIKANKKNIQVVTDRYPQIERAGCCDGPSLSAAITYNPVIKLLSNLEKYFFYRMIRVIPTVIIFLEVDLETAMLRKSDHNPELLEEKIEQIKSLHFNGAIIEKVDARQNYELVKLNILKILEKYI